MFCSISWCRHCHWVEVNLARVQARDANCYGMHAMGGCVLPDQAAVYYGAGYLSLQEVFSVGGVMVVVNALLWGLTGAVWWKICGFY